MRAASFLLAAAQLAAARAFVAPRAWARRPAPTAVSENAQQGWTEYYDETHQRPYYHNAGTGETTWDAPAAAAPAAAAPAAAAPAAASAAAATDAAPSVPSPRPPDVDAAGENREAGVAIRFAPGKGFGAFATRAFAAEGVVGDYAGERLDQRDVDARHPPFERSRRARAMKLRPPALSPLRYILSLIHI